MKSNTDQGRKGTQTLSLDKATISLRLRSGHKYLTLVYQIDLGRTRLLWVATNEPSNPSGILLQNRVRLLGHVGSYLKVIGEKCSEALHIVDRFGDQRRRMDCLSERQEHPASTPVVNRGQNEQGARGNPR